MNRKITNLIRNILDEFIPPIIRDSKYFMYPLFYFWFKGTNISLMMNFKTKILELSGEELINIYKNLDSRARDRLTDMNDRTIKKISKIIDPTAKNILDVGCGNGFFIKSISSIKEKYACDVFEESIENSRDGYNYSKENIIDLNFDNNSFDTVFCSHTLEHIPNIQKAISELKRVAKKEVIIVVPKQRYFYHTLDLHLHFFPDEFSLVNILNFNNYQLFEIDGDWLFIGYKD